MQTLIKRIRTYLHISQAEFAEQVGVTFATVNRWENGHAIPTKAAQSKLYEFCQREAVPVYDMILQRIAEQAANIKLEENRILLYHGSKSGIEGKIEPKSRKQCDFGKGFYMGNEPEQALTLICDYDSSRFYIVSVSLEAVARLDLPVDINWAMLVAFHRGKMEKISGTSFYNKYRDMVANKDLIIGSIANDRMFYVIDNFFVGNITDAALVNSLAALQLGRQYVAVSQKGCDAVRIEAEIGLSHLERLFIKNAAEENRAKGISLANEICKKYRREGMFFDEILDRVVSGGAK